MISRNLLVFCALALYAVSVSARSIDSVEDFEVDDFELDFDSVDEEIERGIKSWLSKLAKEAGKEIAKAALKVLKKEISNIKPECVSKIVKVCDINPVLHPKKFYKCGKAYYKEHKAECRKDKEPESDVDGDEE